MGGAPGFHGEYHNQSIIRVSRAHVLTGWRWLVERQWWIKKGKLTQEIIEFLSTLALNLKEFNLSCLFEYLDLLAPYYNSYHFSN